MARLDPNAVIAAKKLTEYLLVLLPKDDRSQYLALADYTLENWRQLEQDLREQILPLEPVPTQMTKYGQKYAIVGNLTGVNHVTISVKSIWIVENGITRFITLFPVQRDNV
jgi:hypothetical protein